MEIFPRYHQYRLGQLSRANIDITGKSILDYGSNRGNLLEDGVKKGVIDPINYTGMDVDPRGLDFLKSRYPEASTVLYNRHNPVYNEQGTKFKKFPFDNDMFDIVYSYSVNTHSSWLDYKFDISEMVRVGTGLVYTSIMDLKCMKYLHSKRKKIYGTAVDFDVFTNVKTGLYYIDNDTVLDLDEEISDDIDLLLTLYNPEWLISEISKMGLEAKVISDSQPDIQPLLEIKG